MPPAPPPGVATSLAVVPLPGARSEQVLERAEAGGQEQARAEYRAALALLRTRRYTDALAAFDIFLQRHPEHALSDNAVYWRGEAHYAERRYEQALQQFAAVLTRFPDSNKAADSLLKVGLCHLRLGNRVEAARYFERVREQYPNSVAAQSAPREGSS
jgi:tol-pal system protein YbgF